MQSNENKTELVIGRNSWENFLISLERFITVHRRTMEKIRDLSSRNKALRSELLQALEFRTAIGRADEAPIAGMSCDFCGREIPRDARFCDKCGNQTVNMRCVCGRHLEMADKFCDTCGRRRKVF